MSDRIFAAFCGAVAFLLSLCWALTIPIFEFPDEPAHFDYSLSLARCGLLAVSPRSQVYIANDSTKLLYRAANVEHVRFDPKITPPIDYGTKGYYAAIDKADRANATRQCARMSWLSSINMPAYYLLSSLLIKVCAGSIVTALFIARSVSAVCVGLGAAAYALLLIRVIPVRAVAMLLAVIVAAFPLCSFVGGGVQPDAFAFAAVAFSLLIAYETASNGSSVLMIAISSFVLSQSKAQYFLAVIAILALALLRGKASVKQWAALCIPPLLSIAIFALIIGDTRIGGRVAPDLNLHVALPSARAVLAMAREFFFDGRAFFSFWGVYGWMDTVMNFPSLFGVSLWSLLQWCSALGFAAFLGFLIMRCASANGRRLILDDPLLCSLVLYGLFMTVFYLWAGATVAPQGRYWIVVLPAVLAVPIWYVPSLLNGRAAKLSSITVACILLIFDIGGQALALTQVHVRYRPRTADSTSDALLTTSFTPQRVSRCSFTKGSYEGEGPAPAGDAIGPILRIRGQIDTSLASDSSIFVFIDREFFVPARAEKVPGRTDMSKFFGSIAISELRKGQHTAAVVLVDHGKSLQTSCVFSFQL